MTIYEKLRRDHDQLKGLMRRICETTDHDIDDREGLFNQFLTELLAHARAEDETFYDELDEHDEELRSEITAARAEHDMVEEVLGELIDMTKDATDWLPRFMILREALENHIEREETTIFGLAMQAIDDDTADDLAAEMMDLEQDYREAI